MTNTTTPAEGNTTESKRSEVPKISVTIELTVLEAAAIWADSWAETRDESLAERVQLIVQTDAASYLREFKGGPELIAKFRAWCETQALPAPGKAVEA